MVRKEFLIGAATALASGLVFALGTSHFLNNVHHHWIVPSLAGWFFLQVLMAGPLRPDWGKPVLIVVLILAALAGVLLFWRQFSMFQCFRHCEGRLTVGLILLALCFAAAWGSRAFRGRGFLMAAAGLLAAWALTVAAVGVLRGTWNFR